MDIFCLDTEINLDPAGYPPGFLTFKRQVPIVCRKVIIFHGKKSLWDPCIFRHTSPIPPTLWTLDPFFLVLGSQETRTTGAHLCSQILRTAFCTLPPGRSWFNGIFVVYPEVMWTSPKRYRRRDQTAEVADRAATLQHLSLPLQFPESQTKTTPKGWKHAKLGGKYVGWVRNKQNTSANH